MANLEAHLPFRSRTMKEYDQQISELKKENFNLKLRIYFLEDKMHQKCNSYGRDEDVTKLNIELMVELESAKKELADKKELVLKAHQALEALEAQHKKSTQSLLSKGEIERQLLEQQLLHLQQLQANDKLLRPDSVVPNSKRTSIEWFRQAFSFAEHTNSGDEGQDTLVEQLMKKMKDLESHLEDCNYKLETFQREIKVLESTIEAKDDCIKLQEQNQLKRSKAIQGLLKTIQAKNKECEELTRKLEKQINDNKRLKERQSAMTTATMDDGSSAAKASGDDSEKKPDSGCPPEEFEVFCKELKEKDESIQILQQRVNELQTKLQCYQEDSCQKDVRISELLESLASAENETKEAAERNDKPLASEKLVQELKASLCEKDDEMKDLRMKHEKALELERGRLDEMSCDLKSMQGFAKTIEAELSTCREQLQIADKQLIGDKERISDLELDLKRRNESLDAISSYLDKLLEGESFDDQMISAEDGKLSLIGKKLSELYRTLREAVFLNSDGDGRIKSGGESQEYVSLLEEPVSKKLHHFDLIRDSYEKVDMSFASNGDHLKTVKNLQFKLYTCFKDRTFVQDQWIGAAQQLKLLRLLVNGMDLPVVENVEEPLSVLQRVDLEKLASELQNEITLLTASIKSLVQSKKLLQQAAVKCVTFPCLQEQDLLANGGLCDTGVITDWPKESQSKAFNSSNEARLPGVLDAVVTAKNLPYINLPMKDCQNALRKSRDNTEKELDCLKFLLASTESTVRHLSSKVRYYHQTLKHFGISLPNSEKYWCSSENCIPSNVAQLGRDGVFVNGFRNTTSKVSSGRLKSVSAPVSPVKSEFTASPEQLRTVANDCHYNPDDSTFVSDTTLRHRKGNAQRTLQMCAFQSHRVDGFKSDGSAMETQRSSSDVYCQTSSENLVDVNIGTNEMLDESSVALHHVATSRRMSVVLKRHLEEVAEFLEGLLHFDENGLLDISSLTPSKVASIHGHLKATWDLSTTLSQSLTAVNKSLSVVEANISNASGLQVDGQAMKRASQSVSNTREVFTSLRDRAEDPLDPAVLENDTFSQSLQAADNFLLVLKPGFRNGSSVGCDDELPTCSLTFDRQGSFLTSTNVGNYLYADRQKESAGHNSSDSDTWSEPDLGVSQQRIGLKNSEILTPQKSKRFQISPRRRSISLAVTSSSSDITEPNKMFVSKADSPFMSSRCLQDQLLDQRNLDLLELKKEKVLLLAQVKELTEKFESYQETIESLQAMLEDQQKSSKDASVEIDALKAEVSRKDERLKESKTMQQQLQKSLSDVKELLSENGDALAELRQVNDELRDQLESQNEALNQREHEKQELLVSLSRMSREIDGLKAKMSGMSRVASNASLSQLNSQTIGDRSETMSTDVHSQRSSKSLDCHEATSSSLDSVSQPPSNYRGPADKREHVSETFIGGSKANANLEVSPEIVSRDNLHRSLTLQLQQNAFDQTFNSTLQSSPDLGIESDRSHFSSLETSRQNYGSDIEIKSSGITFANLTLLKKSVIEGLGVLRAVRRIAKDHLLRLKGNPAVRPTSEEYFSWKDVYSGCNTIKCCLLESCNFADQMRMESLRMLSRRDDAGFLDAPVSDDKFLNLEKELMEAYCKLTAEKQKADEALAKLEHANKLKRGMEKAIIKQLRKTHDVLMKAKGNLQNKRDT